MWCVFICSVCGEVWYVWCVCVLSVVYGEEHAREAVKETNRERERQSERAARVDFVCSFAKSKCRKETLCFFGLPSVLFCLLLLCSGGGVAE